MDLGAFEQINNLNDIMAVNDISVPRLRGLRLMANEHPYSKEELDKIAYSIGLENCEGAIESGFVMDPISYELSESTRRLKRRYMIYETNTPIDPIGINWSAIHGKKRKMFKYMLRQATKRVYRQYEVWNHYAGRNDILYIHARIGGGNWPYYHSEVDTQSWFLEKVDDAFDSTYCDIYAKIDPDIKVVLDDERQ